MKFFVGDHLFSIQEYPVSDLDAEENYTVGSADASVVMDYYNKALNGSFKGKGSFLFVVKHYESTVGQIKASFKLIEAAGGVVESDEGVLWIYRLGKWDLPKGKIDPGETPEIAAVREIEEECNVKVELGSKIGETWYTYPHKGKQVLKCTHWYVAKSKSIIGQVKLVPQAEENIEAVEWLTPKQVKAKALPSTYASIASIWAEYSKQG